MTFVSPPSATYSIELMFLFFWLTFFAWLYVAIFLFFHEGISKAIKIFSNALRPSIILNCHCVRRLAVNELGGKNNKLFESFSLNFFLLIVSKNIYKKNSSIVPLLRRPGMVFGVTKKCKCKFYKMRNSIKNKIPNNQIACREKKNIKVFIFLITYLISRENLL